MNINMKMTMAFLDAKGVRYQSDEEHGFIKTRWNAKNMDGIEVLVFFDEGDTIALRTFGYVNFPEEKAGEMYKVCSECNKNYRWVKFYVDEDDHMVTLADDAVVQADTCGEEVYDLIGNLVIIGGEAYPNFMKKIWA